MGTEEKTYEYKKESMYTDIPGAGYQYTGGDQKWNYSLIKAYFEKCFDQLKSFNDHSDLLAKALMDFVNDSEHTGDEALASKDFTYNNLYLEVVDTVRAVQILQGMMMGVGFAGSTPLLTDFLQDMDEEESAIITKSLLDKIIIDFARYNNDFVSNASTISTNRDDAEEIIKGCSLISDISLDKIDSKTTQDLMDAFVASNGQSGVVYDFREKFLNFLDEHNDDFSSSEFLEIVERLRKNLNNILNGLGDGSFDPETYKETLNNIERDAGEYNPDYEAYVDSYNRYVSGSYSKSSVYAYDPVNMNTGNFVSKQKDLIVGGKHPIIIERFYNALSNEIGVLGRGWRLGFEEHLYKSGNDISIVFDDGREGLFKKTTRGKEDVYLEIHGEPGILREKDNSYCLTYDDNTYIEFDVYGYVVSFGDNYGCHTYVNYDSYEIEIDGEVTQKALPTCIKTKEGSYVLLKYDENGMIIEVKDHTGRTVQYKYEDINDKYRLTSIVGVDGNVRKYSYTDNGLIHSSTRPDGVIGVVNKYDNYGRVVHQTMPDGGELSYSYDENKHVTTAIEPNGCKVEYLSDEIGRYIGKKYPELGVEEKCTYNAKGFRNSFTDRNGYTTSYTYDNRGHLTGVIGPEGLHEFFTYDSDGKLSSKKDSEGNETKFKYDLEGNLYSIVNPLGEKVRFYYDEFGKVVSIRDAENKRTNLTYDNQGNIASITDVNGIITKYECDSLGRVVATEDAEGNRTTYEFGPNDNILGVVDPEGHETRYEYNALGKVSSITNPDGTKRTWEYNAIGKPAAFTDEENRTTRIFYNLSAKEEMVILPNDGKVCYEYDLLGNLVKVTDPDGRETSYTYDKAGNVTSIQRMIENDAFAFGNESEAKSITISAYTYDGLGRLKTETDGNGNTTSYEYDKNGNTIKITGPNGGVTLKEYDKANRLTRETDALGRVTLYSYDKNGNIKTITDSNGVVTKNTYDGRKLVKVTRTACDEEIIVETYKYDNLGRLKSEIWSDGYEISYTYTRSGKLASAKGSNGRFFTYDYDKCGRVVIVSDTGKETKYSYTATGKLKTVVDALGHKVEYTYDDLDLISKIERFGDDESAEEDGKFPKIGNTGRVTLYEHSLAGNLLSVTDALGQKDTYTYDILGNVHSHTDRDGYETVYSRDNNGNITGINYADGKSVMMSYNALNILQEVKDHLGLTRIESDILGRKTQVTDYKGRTVGYEYGPYDNRSTVIYPDGKRAEYTYDAFGRLINLSDTSSNETIIYSYDEAGRLSGRSFPNGTKTKMEYYQGGLLKSLTSMDSQGVIDSYSYRYDSSSLLTDIDRTRRNLDAVSGEYHYEYDDLGRLTKSTLNGQLRAEYEYDAFGNRLKMTEADAITSYEYDVLDRLTRSVVSNKMGAEVNNAYSYDKRGNQVALSSGDIIKKTFEYDAMGKMTHVTDTERGEASYAYNGLGFRVESSCAEERIEYLCDISRDYYNLLERNVNGEKESFIYDNNVVIMNKGGNNYYYLQDELGSTMYLTGTDGLAVNAYAFDDFGRRVDPYTGKLNGRLGRNEKHHAYTKNGNIIQPFAFTGYQEDEVSQLNFAQARYYDPEAGRFNENDKVDGYTTYADTQNRYLYCLNSPIAYHDLNGFFLQIALGAAVGLVYGVGSELISCAITGKKPNVKDVVAAGIGGAVGGAVTAATGCPALGAAAGSLTTDAISISVDVASGKDVDVASEMGKAFARAGLSAVTAGALDKLGGKLANKVLGENVGIAYDAVDTAVRRGYGTIAEAFMTNPAGYLAKEALSGLPGAIYDTVTGAGYKKLDDALESAEGEVTEVAC